MTDPNTVVKEVAETLDELQRTCNDHLHPSTLMVLRMCERKLKNLHFKEAVNKEADLKNLRAIIDKPVSSDW